MCLGGACELGVLFSLSHEFRVSFVCSLVLVHVFRGSLWFLCSCAGGVEPLCLFLRSRRLTYVFDYSMIGVEPFVPLLEGSCILVSVVSSRCPCLWGPRHWVGLCGFSHAKWPCSLLLCGFLSLGWVVRPLPSQTISLCSLVVNPLLKGEKFGKSSWYEPWFDGDEWLTSVLVRVLWRFGLSILVWWLLGIACW
jgi:hypothetical protein